MARTDSLKPTSKTTKFTKAKTTPARTTGDRTPRTGSQDTKWILVPSGILVLLGAWMFATSVTGASFTFIEPLVALLFTALGVLCTWKIARGEAIRRYVRVIAWILAILIALASVFWFGDADGTCTGIMGTQTGCTENNRFMITVLLLNPFSLTLWAAMAASGIAGILIKTRKR